MNSHCEIVKESSPPVIECQHLDFTWGIEIIIISLEHRRFCEIQRNSVHHTVKMESNAGRTISSGSSLFPALTVPTELGFRTMECWLPCHSGNAVKTPHLVSEGGTYSLTRYQWCKRCGFHFIVMGKVWTLFSGSSQSYAASDIHLFLYFSLRYGVRYNNMTMAG